MSENEKIPSRESGEMEPAVSNESTSGTYDMFLYRRMPRHIFSDPASFCKCSETSSKCKCIGYLPAGDKKPEPEIVEVCRCLLPSSESLVIPRRKLRVLNMVSKTEEYLTKRRIPQLLRWLVTKVTVEMPKRPVSYLERLLNELMLFRAGVSKPPVLYEERHLKAIIKSFDPGQRGWLSSGQVKRLYMTLGLEIDPPKDLEDQVSTDELLKILVKTQCEELLALLKAGEEKPKPPSGQSSLMRSTDFDDITMGGTMSDYMVKDIDFTVKEKKKRKSDVDLGIRKKEEINVD